MKQPVGISEINAIRQINSDGVLVTLRDRKLIVHSKGPGPAGKKYWSTTPLFLKTFNLTSIDELYDPGRLKEVFPSLYVGVEDTSEEIERTSDLSEKYKI